MKMRLTFTALSLTTAIRAAVLLVVVAFTACVSALPGSDLTGNGGTGPPAAKGGAGGQPATGGAGGMSPDAGVPRPDAGPPPPPDGGFAGAAAGGTVGTGPGTGGMSAGTGGGPNVCNPKPCSADPQPGSACMGAPPPSGGSLVSSFENACPRLDPIDGRDGSWFEYMLGSAMVSPSPDQPFRVSCTGAAGSCFAACVSGILNLDAEVGVGFHPRASGAPYDVTAYRGIGFYYQLSVASTSLGRFQVGLSGDQLNGPDAVTDPYMVPLSPIGLWQYREVLFSDLHRQGSGPWDPTAVISFAWNVVGPGPAATGPEPFFLCVDQITLLPAP